LFDNRVRYSLSAYYGIWNHQINQLSIVVPVNTIPTILAGYSNSGKVRMSGIEGEFAFFPTSRLTFNLSGSINDSHILKLAAPTITALTGITDFRGKENPLTSKYSSAVSAEYDVPIAAYDGMTAFGRVDFTYKSGVYTDAANLTRTPDMTQFNLRAGFRTREVTIEAYVSNLFNNKAYPSAIDYNAFNSTFAHTTYLSAVAVALRELRTVGVHARFAF
jgi:iron complex outermembrane receptor protein